MSDHDKLARGSSRPLPAIRNPRIVRVSRASGGKDRHSKVTTVKGLRDRRIRLSVPTAIQLYDLQDKLGVGQPSKAVDWLLDAAQHEIDKLPPLEMSPWSFSTHDQYPQSIPLVISDHQFGSRSNISTDHHTLNINNVNEDSMILQKSTYWNPNSLLLMSKDRSEYSLKEELKIEKGNSSKQNDFQNEGDMNYGMTAYSSYYDHQLESSGHEHNLPHSHDLAYSLPEASMAGISMDLDHEKQYFSHLKMENFNINLDAFRSSSLQESSQNLDNLQQKRQLEAPQQ